MVALGTETAISPMVEESGVSSKSTVKPGALLEGLVVPPGEDKAEGVADGSAVGSGVGVGSAVGVGVGSGVGDSSGVGVGVTSGVGLIIGVGSGVLELIDSGASGTLDSEG